MLETECVRGRLSGLVQSGFFIDIGIPEDYARAGAEPWKLCPRLRLDDIVRIPRDFDTLLLDRDGVINRLRPLDYVKSIEEFEWLPGVKEALATAARNFRHIFIVSNQRGVGRGIMSRDALDDIHDWMLGEISAAGGRIDGIYVCTAVSDDDPCRKPNPGLFREICRDFPDVSVSRTLMVGDSPSDILFAWNCGVAAAGLSE